ncbi:MAG: MFS transporter [Candidatus Woesearchaeota archaeon]
MFTKKKVLDDKKNKDSVASIIKKSRTLSDDIKLKKESSSKAKVDVKDSEPIYVKKNKSINYSVKDGLFTSIKAGFTENFVMPFAIALNSTSGMLAAISSVPQLIASFMQLFAQSSLKLFKTRGRLIFWSAFIQAFMWIPLLLIPLIAGDNIQLAFILVLLFVTLETTIGTFQGPIYNSILGDIIDENKRGEFFGKRNRIVNLLGFISTFIAGLVLSFFKNMDTNGTAHYVFFGFAILFFLAFISRVISAYYKSKIYDPPYTSPKTAITFGNFLKNMTHNNYGIFVLYIFMFKLVANISAPFFALYLLKDMQMNYIHYTMIIGASILASFVMMGVWGKLIDKRGSKLVLQISGFLIPLSPLLLILGIFISDPTTRFIYILLEEMFSGAVWAAFNLSTSSFLFDATEKDERIKYIAYYNFLVGIAVFLGAMLGGVLIKVYPIWMFSAIPYVLLTTGLLRLFVTAVFMKRVKEARMVEIDFSGRGFFHRVVTVNPHAHQHVEVLASYDSPAHVSFHNLLPSTKKMVKTSNSKNSKLTEKELYEKKSFEYYKNNALNTMNQKEKQYTPKDDSDKIESQIEQDKDNISKLAESIKRDKIKK